MKTLGIALGALALGASAASAQVLELRQYRMTPGGRDGFAALFDREFVETQAAVGIALLGQFRDLDDPNRFTWIRAFPDMAARETALSAFYSGDHWKAKRAEANSFILDSDNVLLLKPAGEGWPSRRLTAAGSRACWSPTSGGSGPSRMRRSPPSSRRP